MIRTHFLLITFLLIQTRVIVAQTDSQAISDIQDVYKTTCANIKSYEIKKTDIWDESTEGGMLTAFFDKEELRLMELILAGETGRRKIDYYFDKGRLCFVLDTDYRYNRPIYWDAKMAKSMGDTVAFDQKKTKVYEDRFYFQNDKLIKRIKPKDLNREIPYYTDPEKEIIAYSDKMIKRIKY
jgi:hypothetical protein